MLSNRVEVVLCLECKKFETDSDAATACYEDALESQEKFLCVELMICYTDHTWNTDYFYIPYPEMDSMDSQDEEILTECIKRWTKQEDAARDQRGSVGPGIAKYSLYNVNWDEPVDKDGERIEE